MKHSVSYRPAQVDDAPKLAEISILAGGGTFELLLQNMKRGVDVKAVMSRLAAAPDTEYSFRFFRVAEVDGQIAGGINAISKQDRYKLSGNINPILRREFKFGIIQLAKFYLRARHLKGMNVLGVPVGSLHINDVAVFPEFQGYGIGKQLVLHTIDRAKREGYKFVSLYVWSDNVSAIEFYTRLGFKESKRAPVRPHPKYLPHSESVMMLFDLSSASIN